MIFVDSNIVIDLLEGDGGGSGWSRTALGDAGARNGLVANVVVLAESAPRFPSSGEQLDYFDAIGVKLADIPAAAAFHAGQAHKAYRRAGGKRVAMVADFLIGGHAASLGATLLTRDRRRFATYFPDLPLITPDTHP